MNLGSFLGDILSYRASPGRCSVCTFAQSAGEGWVVALRSIYAGMVVASGAFARWVVAGAVPAHGRALALSSEVAETLTVEALHKPRKETLRPQQPTSLRDTLSDELISVMSVPR